MEVIMVPIAIMQIFGKVVSTSQPCMKTQRSLFEDVDAARMLMVNFRQPSQEFTFGVGINFISYPLVLTPLI
jgi:hypothetical protein